MALRVTPAIDFSTFPESDGAPMAETIENQTQMMDLMFTLRQDKRVSIMSDDRAVNGSAVCVDCRQEVPDERVFRVLRTDRAGRRHVVCQDCADRRHAEARPVPLQVQRSVPPHTAPSPGSARSEPPARPGDEH